MDLSRVFDTVGLASFILLLFLAFSMLIDFIIASRYNGIVVRRKVEVWAAFTFMFAWVVAGRLEQMTDWYPGMDVALWCRRYQWLPNGITITAMARLWYALHLARQQDDAKPEE